MAEIVSSAVVQESVSQILSGLVHRCEEKAESNLNIKLERLEMAHIKLESAIETSEKWQIRDASLLRWRKKLKRAAQECDDMLHKCKRRVLEDEQMEQEVKNSSLPNRIAHATKSFVFSIFSISNNELSSSTVRRFEWFAAGAREFLRFIELGGTPRRHVPFDSLVRNLFAGKELHHEIFLGNKHPLFQLWLVPYSASERGIEASLICIQKGGTASEGTIYFGLILQLSESTDIVGTAIKCLQLFAPHFRSTVERVRRELIRLPIQDLSWVPHVYSCQKDHWDNLHSLGTQWFRPNPLCCKQHDRHDLHCISNLDMAGMSDVLLEPVIEVNFQCQVSLSLCHKQNTSLSEDNVSLKGPPYLKAGVSFAPHGSSGGMLPANKCSAIAAIVGKEQHWLHADITLEQLEEIMLPKAIDYFCQNTEATVYQMIWKSKHGSALIQFEKASMSTRRTFGGARKRKPLQGQDQELRSRTRMISHLLDLWAAYVPGRLQSLLMDWVEKEKEIRYTNQQGKRERQKNTEGMF